MICALLLGREGSTGFPGKNLYPVLGRPMVAYPLMGAAAASTVDRVYVSTDSPAIKRIAADYGARVIDRPPHLATATALGEDAYVHGYQVIRDELAAEGHAVELIVCLFANAPMTQASMIDDGVRVLRAHPDYDSAITVSCYNMWSPFRARRVGANGLLAPYVSQDTIAAVDCDRDSQGDFWFADFGASIVRPRCFERIDEGVPPQRWFGRRVYPLEQWGGLDVDFEWQMPQVEFWLRQHGFTDATGDRLVSEVQPAPARGLAAPERRPAP